MTTRTQSYLWALCFCCFTTLTLYGQNNAGAPELNITLGEQRVRFAPTRGFQEMRLEVVNSVGEIIFSHSTTEAEFDWNLHAANSESLAPGLYRYALTLKYSEDLSRQHTGHFIVEQGQDQIWLTANEGAEVSGTTLNAARSGGRSIAGIDRTDDKSVKQGMSGREIVDEKGNKLPDEKDEKKAVKAALLGTANIVAKFDAGGVNLIDSAITETGGNVGIGITNPNAKLAVSANTATPPSTPGIIGYFANANENNTFMTADSYGNGNWHSDFLFRRARGTMAAPLAIKADDIVGQIQMRGYGTTGFATTARAGIRMTAAEDWSDTAQGAYLAFMTNPIGSANINVERMRINHNGNVGIGTPDPKQALQVNGTTSLGAPGWGLWLFDWCPFARPLPNTYYNGAQYLAGVAGYGGLIQFQDGDGSFGYYTTDVSVAAGAAHTFIPRLTILRNGFVGIGTPTPDFQLHVSSIGTAIFGGSNEGSGIRGLSLRASLFAAGVLGFNNASGGIGVIGEANDGTAIGVFGVSDSSTGFGMYGRNQFGGYAGYFDGKVRVTGVIEKPGGGFKIDHPLDPENKYLVHSFVESPDMKNLYDGTVTTDAQGEAEITLPDWFAALNRDFRYQLTCIGVFAQAIIAEEIKDNRFKIRTSWPQVKVSWQVTGTRQDAWANKNRLPVEEAKPEVERGFYQNPDAFGQPEEKGLEWAIRPAQMKEAKERREKAAREQADKTAAPAARP